MITGADLARMERHDWQRARVDDDAPLVLVTLGEDAGAIERRTYTLADLLVDVQAGRLGPCS